MIVLLNVTLYAVHGSHLGDSAIHSNWGKFTVDNLFQALVNSFEHYFLQCPRCGYAVAIGKQEYLNIKNGVPQEQIPAAENPFGEEFNAAPQTLSGIT